MLIQPKKRIILIIDDSLEDREAYRRYLQQDSRYTYTILEEEYGEQGLELCSRVKPDAILLDFLLPDINGLEFLSELKTQTGKNKLPVVMLTGQGNEEVAVAAMKSGAQDYLVKGGMTPENLRLAIHHTLEREQLKRQLEEKEERVQLLESVVVNTNDAVIVTTTLIDDPEPCILYVNQAFTRMTGYSAQEVLGQSPRFLQGSKTDRTTLDRIRSALSTRQPIQVELINYRKDGSEFWVELGITPVVDATGKCIHFVGIQRDITERKLASEALRQSEHKYRLLAEATPQFVWTAQHDGAVEYCNRYWYEYTGLAEAQTLGWGWTSVLHPEDREQALANCCRAQVTGEGYEIEYRFKRAVDGSYRWHLGRVTPLYNEQGRLAQWMGIGIDIHDRKQAEEQLRQSQRFIQRIAETSPSILYLYDFNEQHYVYLNRRLTEILGNTQLTRRELKRVILQRLMHPDDFMQWCEYMNKLSSQREDSIFEFEYRMKDMNGAWHWFYSRDTVFTRTAEGLPQQLLGIAQEITARKQSEAERAQLLAQEQAARSAAVSAAARSEAANRAKDEFLAMVSHELRNPLNAILAYAQLLQTRQLNEPTFVRALETIERNAKLQAKLINDLLDISRITSGTLRLNREPVELAVVIESVIDTLRLTAQAKAIKIESRIEPIFGYVLGDEERLQQVIGNLLSNAIKFTPDKGRIQVKLKDLNTHVQVQIKDTGQGIRAEFLPYVFEPFRQAAGTVKQGGLGLGLAIVRHLVELHGGAIAVASPGEGQGATFTLELPLVDDEF